MPVSPLHFGAANPQSDATSLLDAPASPELTEWLRYDRPATNGSVASPVQVPTRDGTLLSGVLYRPAKDGSPVEGQFPSVLQDFCPYPSFGDAQPTYLAERGYVVLTCSVRGSGESEGEWSSWFPEVEAHDNYDVIEWLAAQPYSDGHVGQLGASYSSITAYRVAALRPPHLNTIVPIVSPTDIYSDWIRPGGVPTEVRAWWAGLPLGTKEEHTSTLKSFEDHPLQDSFWHQVATANKLSAVEVPALHIGGYYDIFKNGGFDALDQRPEKTWLLYGPWTHLGIMTVPGVAPTPFDGDPANAISFATVLQWFDYWLAGLPEASLPPARVVTYEDRSERAAGSWAEFDQWPPAAATNTRLYPTADGELARELPAPGTTTYAVNPYDGPSACVIGCLPTDADQNQMMSELNITNAQGRYAVGGRTTFTTPAFEKDVVVSGPVYFQFRAALTADDTYFVSKLEVLTAAGQVLPLETGYLRAQTRSSLERLERITPGDAVDYRIALGHIHFRFDAGQSLRITIGGGDVPRVLPTSPAGIVSVHHGESTFVDLSLIGY